MIITKVGEAYFYEEESKTKDSKLFTYTWVHLPSGRMGTQKIMCKDKEGAKSIVNSWNKTAKTHKYWLN